MIETRIYITRDLSKKDVNNIDFIKHCEIEGGVYSLQGCKDAWNTDNFSIMRILDVDIPDEDEKKLGFDYIIPTNTKDSDNGCIEWCPECDCEVLLENKFCVQICPNCGKKILPCAQCEKMNCSNCPLTK